MVPVGFPHNMFLDAILASSTEVPLAWSVFSNYQFLTTNFQVNRVQLCSSGFAMTAADDV